MDALRKALNDLGDTEQPALRNEPQAGLIPEALMASGAAALMALFFGIVTGKIPRKGSNGRGAGRNGGRDFNERKH